MTRSLAERNAARIAQGLAPLLSRGQRKRRNLALRCPISKSADSTRKGGKFEEYKKEQDDMLPLEIQDISLSAAISAILSNRNHSDVSVVPARPSLEAKRQKRKEKKRLRKKMTKASLQRALKKARITIITPIDSSNKGFNMLCKSGWKKGEGLGRRKQGIKQPVQAKLRPHAMHGLG